MSKRVYGKKPLSVNEQIALLRSRGLEIPDEQRAFSYLNEISYYRLSAYFLPYQQQKDRFNEGVTFDQILDTYTFDRELRLLVFDCIERIGVAVRTQMVHSMAVHHNDPHWQDKPSYYQKPYYNRVGRQVDPHGERQSIVSRAMCAKRPEVFIEHYRNSYHTPSTPPSWMCLELLTMGELSHVFSGLRDNADKKRIADFFRLHHRVFASWLHSLTYVRNICAHHSRLWNRNLAIEPTLLRKPEGPWISKPFENNRRVFYFLCTLKYLLQRANASNHFGDKLQALFSRYPNIAIQYLGIPSDEDGNLLDWRSEPLWCS